MRWGAPPALEAAVPLVGMTLIRATVRDTAETEGAIAAIARDPGGGLAVMPDVFTALDCPLIIMLAAPHQLPAVYPFRFHAADGGLMSYGPDHIDHHRQAASYVDRILQGAKPADPPVQTPTKFEMVINLKTAKALSIEIPAHLLARGDEIIEASIRVHEALQQQGCPDPCSKRDAKWLLSAARNASVEQDVLYFVFPNSAFAESELNLETINTKVKERAFGLYNKLRGAS
jgi:ABC transporter substrate binding protein